MRLVVLPLFAARLFTSGLLLILPTFVFAASLYFSCAALPLAVKVWNHHVSYPYHLPPLSLAGAFWLLAVAFLVLEGASRASRTAQREIPSVGPQVFCSTDAAAAESAGPTDRRTDQLADGTKDSTRPAA